MDRTRFVGSIAGSLYNNNKFFDHIMVLYDFMYDIESFTASYSVIDDYCIDMMIVFDTVEDYVNIRQRISLKSQVPLNKYGSLFIIQLMNDVDNTLVVRILQNT